LNHHTSLNQFSKVTNSPKQPFLKFSVSAILSKAKAEIGTLTFFLSSRYLNFFTMFLSFLLLVPSALSTNEFLSIGDWGDKNAKKISDYMGYNDPEWLIAIGDNFYSDGVVGVDDPQFKEKFEDTFTAKSLQVPWYVCSGNHDYYGGDEGIAAEIAYSGKSSRWIFPSFYYDKVLTMDNNATVHLFALDTWRLNGGDTYVNFDPITNRAALKNASNVEYRYQIGSSDMGKAKRDILLKTFEDEDPNNPIQLRDDQDQLDWLTKGLAGSTSDWKVVFGHFPIYSATKKEHGNTKKLIEILLPVLQEGKADLYFSGHDHILQHISRDGVHFMGSGAGAQKHTGINSDFKGLLGSVEGHYGFMVHKVTSSKLITIFVTDENKKPYNYTISK